MINVTVNIPKGRKLEGRAFDKEIKKFRKAVNESEVLLDYKDKMYHMNKKQKKLAKRERRNASNRNKRRSKRPS